MSSNKYDDLLAEIKENIDQIVFKLNLIYRNKDRNNNEVVNLKESLKEINVNIKKLKFRINVLTNFKKEIFKLFKSKMLFSFIIPFLLTTGISIPLFSVESIIGIALTIIGGLVIGGLISSFIYKDDILDIISIKLNCNLEKENANLENLLVLKELKTDWLEHCLENDLMLNSKIEMYSQKHAELIKYSYDVEERKLIASRFNSETEKINDNFEHDQKVQITLKLIREKNKN